MAGYLIMGSCTRYEPIPLLNEPLSERATSCCLSTCQRRTPNEDTDPFSPLSDDTNKIYSAEICVAALRGESLPTLDINAMSYTLQLCVLRGIRHHDGFATDLLRDLQTVAQKGVSVSMEAFQRTRHARAIMSNTIPDISSDDEIPYCIWYPDVASENTYRALARRYPKMRYQIGRACAVAGYSDLYTELNLLPDIAIAEEARDSVVRSRVSQENRGSQSILDCIVEQPVRWQVMNDYTKHVELDNPPVARHGLNGDTAVVSTLALRRDFTVLREQPHRLSDNGATLQPPLLINDEPAPCYFNITEDWNVDCNPDTYISSAGIHDKHYTERPVSESMLELLWTPLLHHLPWGDKDLLILMAAYHGDVDRYARLRRPQPVSHAESHCVNRGIYHSTAFAKWWSLQDDGNLRFSRSIHARFIMVNDLSRITADTPDEDLPRQIWYPLHAQPETYLELARRKPAMLYVVARALVVADYADAWDALVGAGQVEPYHELMEEAKVRAGSNPHYMQALDRICAERGMQVSLLESKYSPDDRPLLAERTTALLVASPGVDSVQWEQAPGLYDGVGADTSEVELYIASSREERLQLPAGFDELDPARLYVEQQNPSTTAGEESGVYRRRGITRGRGGRGRN